MLLPNFYHPFFLYCVKTPTNDDGNFGELEFLCTFVAKSKPLSKTRQSIANRTVSKSLPEHQPIVRNTLLQRVVAFLSKVTTISWDKHVEWRVFLPLRGCCLGMKTCVKTAFYPWLLVKLSQPMVNQLACKTKFFGYLRQFVAMKPSTCRQFLFL